MFFKIVQFLIIFVVIVHTKRLSDSEKAALEKHKKCHEAELIQIHPLDCCKYPRFYDNRPYIAQQCGKSCRLLPYSSFSCEKRCIIEKYDVITEESGGIVNINNRILDAFCDQDDKECNRPLGQNWFGQVRNASYECIYEFPLTPGMTFRNVSNQESWNYYYTNYVECIRKNNFLNCKVPNPKPNPDCKKFNEILPHCLVMDYPYLHSLFFEDFYYRNLSEKRRLEQLKRKGEKDLYEVTDSMPVSSTHPPTSPSTTERDEMEESDEENDEKMVENENLTTKINN